MNTRKAEAYPGSRAVLRYDDPEMPEMANLGGHVPNLVTVLPSIAYFQGEEVGAMVAADTESIVDEALKLIEVEWDERPFVLDEEKAVEEKRPLANPELYPDGNHYNEGFLDVEQHGDVEQGFAEADEIMEFKVKRRQYLDGPGTSLRRCPVERGIPGSLAEAAASPGQQKRPFLPGLAAFP